MTDAAFSNRNKFTDSIRSIFSKCIPIKSHNRNSFGYQYTGSSVGHYKDGNVISHQNSDTLNQENEEFLSLFSTIPTGKSNSLVYKRAVESAFARIIQQAENIKTYEQYIQFCEVCSEYEQYQPIRIAFCSIYLTDMRLRRDVEALFIRAAEEFSESTNTTNNTAASLQLNLMAILYLISVTLAEASIDFTTALSLQRFFTESLARVIVEGMAFYATMYFQSNTKLLNRNNKNSDDLDFLGHHQYLSSQSDSATSLIDKSLKQEYKEVFNPKKSNHRQNNSFQKSREKFNFVNKRSKSLPYNMFSDNQMPLLTVFLRLEKKSLYYKRIQLFEKNAKMYCPSLTNKDYNKETFDAENNNNNNRLAAAAAAAAPPASLCSNRSCQFWSSSLVESENDITEKNKKMCSESNISNINDSISCSDRGMHTSNTDTTSNVVTLRCEIIQQFSNCIGRFIFGTFYVSIAAVPQCQQKLFIIFSYLNETKELNPLLNIILIVYWIEAVVQCAAIFHLIATSAPLCIAFLKIITKVTSFIQQDSIKNNFRELYKIHTLISRTPKSSYCNMYTFTDKQYTSHYSSSVFSTFKSLLSCSKSRISEISTTNNSHQVSQSVNIEKKINTNKPGYFDINNYISVIVHHVLLKLITCCREHYYHEIPNIDRPLFYDMKIENILQKHLRIPKNSSFTITKGNILTCKHPVFIALRNSIRQVTLLASLITKSQYKYNLSFLEYIDLLLVLENYSLTQSFTIKESLIISHKFKESIFCCACGKSCLIENRNRKKKIRKYPITCLECNMVRYCSVQCEKCWKNFHANWCSTLEKYSYV